MHFLLQAYRNHPLYALERWLTKYQIIHPKDPVLGFCNGYPVYRRNCVQTLKTREKWLREGLQVKLNEAPAKVYSFSVDANFYALTSTKELIFTVWNNPP